MTTPTTTTAVAPTVPSAERRSVFWALVSLLAISSWGLLWLWSASPYERYLEHGGWLEAGALAALCRAVPQGDMRGAAVLHAARGC